MSKEAAIDSLKDLEVTLSRLTGEVSMASGSVDELDMSYTVQEVKEQLESIENDIALVIDAMTEVRDSIGTDENDYTGQRDAQRRLGRNIADVLNLMSIGAQRFASLQHAAFDDSDFTLQNLSVSDVTVKAEATYALYWMLIDFFGYSDEDFRMKLTSKKLDYTFRDRQEHA